MTELTRRQMAALLGVCSRFDGRTLDEATFEAWHLLLADLPYEDMEDAIKVHYRTDRRWIMPADIVAHHEQLQAGRAIEACRLSPPACWGCTQSYVLSDRPGSRYALPAGPHDDGCLAIQGVLVFDPDDAARQMTGYDAQPHPGWAVMTVDPATFNEAALEAARQASAPNWLTRDTEARRALEPGGADDDH